MVVSVQKSQAHHSPATKLKSIEKTSRKLTNPIDIRVRMADVLQSSLELETVLNLFMENVSAAVKLDGIQYFNDAQGIEKAIAKQSSHSCGYRLITSQDKLGEIVFKRSRKFSEKELGILESLLAPLISPLRNALLYSTAVNAVFKDPMTGAGNSHLLKASLDREIELSKRHNQSLSVVMIEIDKLKEFRQAFGTDYHDKIVNNLAKNIDMIVRTTDSVFKLSDSLFLVLLSSTDKIGGQIITGRLEESILKKGLIGKMSAKKKSLGMTSPAVHLGLTTLTGTDTSKSFLDRAKKAICRSRKTQQDKISH